MKIPIKLVRQGLIPRDPGLVLRLQREPKAAKAVAAGGETSTESSVTIGAGADNFADATSIEAREFRDVVAGYTYNKAFSVEAGEPAPFGGGEPDRKTAWWRITVPADKVLWLSVDTQLSFGNSGNPDTEIAIYSIDYFPATPVLGDLGGLATTSEDVGSGIDARGTGYYSRLDNVELDGSWSGDSRGTLYFIQVGDYQGGVPGICYVVRFSLSEVEPGAVPTDGVDPDV